MKTIQLEPGSCPESRRTSVEEAIRDCLFAEAMYGYYFKRVRFDVDEGVVTLQGCVPTFYLKQVLQTRLANVAGVRRIDNRVDVVNSRGLSSITSR